MNKLVIALLFVAVLITVANCAGLAGGGAKGSAYSVGNDGSITSNGGGGRNGAILGKPQGNNTSGNATSNTNSTGSSGRTISRGKRALHFKRGIE